MDSLSSNTPQDKKCTGPCGRTLPATSQYFHAHHKGILRAECKECRSNKSKTRRKEHPEIQQQYYASHREEKLRYAAEYRAAHKEEHAEYCAKYNLEHREEIKKRQSEYNLEHQEERREHNKRYYAEHSEEARQYSATYRKEHPEQVERYREEHRLEHRQYDVLYNLEHQEKKKAYRINYCETHYEQLKQGQQRYYQSERGRIAARTNAHNRRALKRNASGSHTTEELYQQYKRQKGRCYYCHAKLGKGRDSWHGDHVVPLARGGSNDISNIVAACPACNVKKRDKLPHEFFEGGRLL